VKAAWDTALRFHPYAISQGLGGPPLAYYQPEFEQAAKEGIKLVAFSETSVQKPWAFGVGYGVGGIGQWGFGGLSAAYAASKIQNGDHVLMLNLPGVGLVQVQDQAFQAALTKLCPKTQFSTLNIPLSALGKDAPQMIASYIQSHPDIKYIFYTTIDLGIGVGPAFSAAGITSPPPGSAVTTDPAGLQIINQGQGNIQATIMYPSLEGAYRLLDGLGRIYRGQSPTVASDATLEKWIVTKNNLPSGESPLPAVKNYAQQFYKLWGITG
jgi:ribose transport system substrate-binding protein